jgi:hypothetical protein
MQKAVRDALIAFMAAEAVKEAQRAGIEHAKAAEPHSIGAAEQVTVIRDKLAQRASHGYRGAAQVSRQ